LNAARESVAYYNFPQAELDAVMTDADLTLADRLVVIYNMCLTYRTKNLSTKIHLKTVAHKLQVSRDTIQRRYAALVKAGYLAYETQGVNDTEIHQRAAPKVRAALEKASTRSTRIGKCNKAYMGTSISTPATDAVAPTPPPLVTTTAVAVEEASVMPQVATETVCKTLTESRKETAPIPSQALVKRTPPTPEALAAQIARVTVETVGSFSDLNVDPATIPLILESGAVPYYLGNTALTDVVLVHGYDNMRAKLPLSEVLGRAYALRYRYQAAESYHCVSLAKDHGTRRSFARMDAISDYARTGYSQADLNLALLCKTWLKESQSAVDIERKNKDKIERERQRQEAYVQQKSLIEAEKAALAAQAAAGEIGPLLPFGKDLVILVQTTLQQQLEQGSIHPNITQGKSLSTLVTEILSYLNSQSTVTRETRWSKCLYLCRIGGWRTPTYLSGQ
ncbi:MAG: hypothetical protein V4490_03815, partial [Pseudomonadota bacterium]